MTNEAVIQVLLSIAAPNTTNHWSRYLTSSCPLFWNQLEAKYLFHQTRRYVDALCRFWRPLWTECYCFRTHCLQKTLFCCSGVLTVNTNQNQLLNVVKHLGAKDPAGSLRSWRAKETQTASFSSLTLLNYMYLGPHLN